MDKKNKRQIAVKNKVDKSFKTLCYTNYTISVNKNPDNIYKFYYPKPKG